jgi:predicted dehydrogenase
MADDSWNREWQAFAEDIRTARVPCPGIEDAQAALRVVEEVYRKSALPSSERVRGALHTRDVVNP